MPHCYCYPMLLCGNHNYSKTSFDLIVQPITLKDGSWVGAKAVVCRSIDGDHIACIGENRKMLIFPITELPDMTRGKGVRMQKYKDGGLSDALSFNLALGLTWKDPADRQRTEMNLEDWISKRAASGRMAPRGFPRNNRFDYSL